MFWRRNRGPEFGKASPPVGLALIVVLLVATVLLIRNMNKQIGKLPETFEPEHPEADQPPTRVPTGAQRPHRAPRPMRPRPKVPRVPSTGDPRPNRSHSHDPAPHGHGRLGTMATNRLRHSTSPYLRQHADNPVHWHEWNDAALTEARDRDVPILLSVGYAACHWCHVMAHESFEDDATAAVMNENFVCIKVDREERPDLDAVYMNATVAATGQGGWPMTCFLTADGAPFYCGTYYPRSRAGGACRRSRTC